MIALTGAQLDISAGGYDATVTELGAGLRRLRHEGRPLIVEYAADELPPAGAGQLLVPWPNRVDRGRYSFAGHSYQLDLSEPTLGNAIHGLTRWTRWVLRGQSASQVELAHTVLGSPGYSFTIDLNVSYQLDAASGLTVTLAAVNAGSRPAPYGMGAHPYLVAGTQRVDSCVLRLPAARWLPVDARGIPSGPLADVTTSEFDFRKARPIGSTRLDHAFGDLLRGADGRAWAYLAASHAATALWAGPGCDWLQVFTGDPLGPELARRAVAIEPMSCPPNAFATGTGLITLEPGERVSHSWGIRAMPPPENQREVESPPVTA